MFFSSSSNGVKLRLRPLQFLNLLASARFWRLLRIDWRARIPARTTSRNTSHRGTGGLSVVPNAPLFRNVGGAPDTS
jgi:hypothetical protein